MLRWEGPFVDNVPHGVGQAYVANRNEDEHERWSGDTAVKGPPLEFENGRPARIFWNGQFVDWKDDVRRREGGGGV